VDSLLFGMFTLLDKGWEEMRSGGVEGSRGVVCCGEGDELGRTKLGLVGVLKVGRRSNKEGGL